MWNVCTSVRQYALPARLAHAEQRERQPTWVWFGAPVVWLRPCLVRKNFQDSPSHRIFGRMHGALNKDKNKN